MRREKPKVGRRGRRAVRDQQDRSHTVNQAEKIVEEEKAKANPVRDKKDGFLTTTRDQTIY